MARILLLMCVACLISGVALAFGAPRLPARTAALELWGGAVLVLGLALLGAALQRSE